jgi:uncharacterized protein (DUF2141 family)
MLWLSLFFYSAPNHNQTKLTITIQNISPVQGKVYVGLYNSKADFPKEDKVFQGKVVDVTSAQVSCTFEVPNGNYAVSSYHDKNSNGKLDKNLMGVPTEAYGFSNNARGTFGPPSFEDAKVVCQGGTKNIQITLK